MPEEIESQPGEIIEEKPKVDCLSKLKIHKFKILGGVLGVFIFVGAVFGAYKLGQKQVQPAPQPVPTPITVATPTSIPKVSPMPTSLLPKPTTKPGWKSCYNSEIGFTYQLPQESWQSIQHPEGSLCDLRLERNEGDQYICVRSMSNPKGLSRRNFFCYEVIFFGRGEEQDVQERCFKYLQEQELKIGDRDALKIHFASGGSDAGDYYVLSNKGGMVVISDYYALFPKTANPPGFSWKTLRDGVVATFWFE